MSSQVTENTKDILLSIKPYWVEKMLTGDKTVELKKVFSKEPVNRIFIYVSAHVQKVCGYMVNPKIERMPVDELWEKTKDLSCVPSEWFFPYFSKSSVGVGIFFDRICKLPKPVKLNKLALAAGKSYYARAPQNFYYLNNSAVEYLLRENKK